MLFDLKLDTRLRIDPELALDDAVGPQAEFDDHRTASGNLLLPCLAHRDHALPDRFQHTLLLIVPLRRPARHLIQISALVVVVKHSRRDQHDIAGHVGRTEEIDPHMPLGIAPDGLLGGLRGRTVQHGLLGSLVLDRRTDHLAEQLHDVLVRRQPPRIGWVGARSILAEPRADRALHRTRLLLTVSLSGERQEQSQTDQAAEHLKELAHLQLTALPTVSLGASASSLAATGSSNGLLAVIATWRDSVSPLSWDTTMLDG